MGLFIGKGTGAPLVNATDLRDWLHPSKRYQYRDGYSMAEAAKSWVADHGNLPDAVAQVIGSPHLEKAHFEYPTGAWGGGTAMTDVMAFIPDGVVAVEAKARECFDLVDKTNNPNFADFTRFLQVVGPAPVLEGVAVQVSTRPRFSSTTEHPCSSRSAQLRR